MPPDRRLSIQRYQTYSKTYDQQQTRNTAVEENRERVIELLALRPGDIVLDAGCGTGLNFSLIEDAIGPGGRIIGIDQSPEMLEQARKRAAEQGWQNVTLINSAVEDAPIAGLAAAVLFGFTHDILQSAPALDNIFAHAKPGARVASIGYKWPPMWALPWVYVVWNMTRRSVTTRENFGAPWRNLERYVANLQIGTMFLGAMYLAWGETASG